jgi:hypothetical protein
MATASCLLAGWSRWSHSTSASSTSVAIAPPSSASADAPASSIANAAAAAVSSNSAGTAPGSTEPATARSALRRCCATRLRSEASFVSEPLRVRTSSSETLVKDA